MTSTLLSLALVLAAPPDRPFRITVVDEQTGRGVPLVELRTVNGLRSWTDSNGIVAFHEPGLMGQTVFFHVSSHGYEFPRDGFGYRGKALAVVEGGRAELKIKRLNIAERLYRVTGGGIYADSLLVGEKTPLKRPSLNAQVLGSDSVMNAVYRGKLYWFWGDTNRPSYPLGNFHVPGATSLLPAQGGLAPERGIDLEYFLDDKGFARATARLPGEGPTWITALAALPDGPSERLFASYVKVKPPLEIYERGLAVFDDTAKEFRALKKLDAKAPLAPQGQALRHTVKDVEHVLFAHPYPLTRVRADAASFQSPAAYEGFSCLEEGSRLEDGRIDRVDGRVRYAWKKNTPTVGPAEQAKLVSSGRLKPDEALLALRDIESGKAVQAHSGSVNWNAHRRRWVLIAVQSFGTSLLGEVWYAEADTPLGPWVYARKVVTHDRYSFYNPKQHPYFDQDGGRVIYFEGTYTHTFSGNNDATPRYDYNQVMYRLDLSDARLALPVAYYPRANETPMAVHDLKPGAELRPAFFALDRPVRGAVPIHRSAEGRLTRDGPKDRPPLFYALPPQTSPRPPETAPLYEFADPQGRQWAYGVESERGPDGYRRAEVPLCLVWRNPSQVTLRRE